MNLLMAGDRPHWELTAFLHANRVEVAFWEAALICGSQDSLLSRVTPRYFAVLE